MSPPSAHSQQLAVRPEKRVRAVEIADENLMRHHAAESLPRKPAVEIKRRRLDLERWLAQFFQIQIDGVIWRRADRRWHAGKHRQRRAMNVAGGDQLHARVASDNRRQFAGIEQILTVPGIDAVFVGPYDLSNSMGLVGQVSHPDVVAAIDKVRAACGRTNLAMGIYCSNADQARNEIKAGVRMVAVGTDIMHMANSARSTLEALRDE